MPINSSTEAINAGLTKERAELIYPSQEKIDRDNKIIKAAKIVTIALAAIAFVALVMAAIAIPGIMVGIAIPIVILIACSSVGGGALVGAIASGAIWRHHYARIEREEQAFRKREEALLTREELALVVKAIQNKLHRKKQF